MQSACQAAGGRDDTIVAINQIEAVLPETPGRANERSSGRARAGLAEQTPIGTADYYLCGQRPFLRARVSDLRAAGVSEDRIHYEFFGPADEILAA
ncbi:hypothetical protein [Brevundimonas naejangsanensis]|uniref:hypothetical protein n=1 Tax=Brevundimonas naejangsanensis TaxID=588932 RepID=UPI003D01FE0D